MKKHITKVLTISFALSSIALARPDRPKMDAATEAAFAECAEENNLPDRDSGTRPTKAQMEKMDECLSEKGIEKPEHHERKGPPRDFTNQ